MTVTPEQIREAELAARKAAGRRAHQTRIRAYTRGQRRTRGRLRRFTAAERSAKAARNQRRGRSGV